jgi:hypothetical protein
MHCAWEGREIHVPTLSENLNGIYHLGDLQKSVRKVWNQWEFCHLLFTLYTLNVYPDTLRVLSAVLPCFCGFSSPASPLR